MKLLNVEINSSFFKQLYRSVLSVIPASAIIGLPFAPILGIPAVAGTIQVDLRNPEKVVNLTGFESKGGLINLVEGDVSINSKGNLEEAALQRKLATGDSVVTGSRSRAEILLNPGYFLRVGPDTEFRLAHLSIEDQRLEVIRGALIVEITHRRPSGFYDPYTLLTASTPFGDVSFPGMGVFFVRVSATEADVTAIKGKAVVAKRTLAAGNKAVLQPGNVVTSSTQPLDDELSQWNAERARAQARLNARVAGEDWYKQQKGRSYIRLTEDTHTQKSLYTTSAAGGHVRFVEDVVTFRRGEAEWAPLKPESQLQDGDLVRTGSGRAELMLIPGVFIRLAAQTEITYSRPTGRRAELGLARGSMIVEAVRPESLIESEVVLRSAHAECMVTRVGNYRLNASETQLEALIRDGRIAIGKTEFGRGKRVVCSSQGCRAEAFDGREQDSFDLWSARRTEKKIVVNPNVLVLTISGKATVGVWYFLSVAQSYAFIPLYWGGQSPYGDKYPVMLRPFGPWPGNQYGPKPPMSASNPY
jgi:hypothetical protein